MNLATPQTILTEALMIDPRAVPGLVDEARIGFQSGRSNAMRSADGELVAPRVGIDLYDDMGVKLQMADSGEPDTEGHPAKSLIAVVALTGVITRHGYAGWWSSAPGTIDIGRHLLKLDRDDAVGTIILLINSPGGTVYGTPELAELVYGIRKGDQTRIVSTVDALMASAATYIGTAAEQVFAIPSADVGSVGVINSYADYSEMLTKQGIKVEFCRVPEKKARFTGYEPMDDDMRETMQARIEEAYGWFVRDMARNRGVSEKYVREHFGQGEVMSAQDGVDAKLIDRIASIDDIIGELAAETRRGRLRRSRTAAAETLEAVKKMSSELDMLVIDGPGGDEEAESSESDTRAEAATATSGATR